MCIKIKRKGEEIFIEEVSNKLPLIQTKAIILNSNKL